MLEQSVMAG